MDKVVEKYESNKIIVPAKYRIDQNESFETNVCVVAHMHYVEDAERHWNYLKNIAGRVDIYITTSSDDLYRILLSNSEQYNRITVLKKDNRGRDISSLLVTCREAILEYDYVCFIHDKKEKKENEKNDVAYLNDLLWQSMIGTSIYFGNVISIIKTNDNIGVLTPFPILHGRLMTELVDAWYDDYDNTQNLLNDLSMNYVINRNEQPITLWTVFWARVEAIRPLMDRKWSYEDFDPEPLARDGTLSHAIERSIGYISRANGFDVVQIIPDNCALKDMEYRNKLINKAWICMNKYIGIDTLTEFDYIDETFDGLYRFAMEHNSIYIYGAGQYGQKCLKQLRVLGITIQGFIVTRRDMEEVLGAKVYELTELTLDRKCGVVIAVRNDNRDSIISSIIDRGIDVDTYIFMPYGV